MVPWAIGQSAQLMSPL